MSLMSEICFDACELALVYTSSLMFRFLASLLMDSVSAMRNGLTSFSDCENPTTASWSLRSGGLTLHTFPLPALCPAGLACPHSPHPDPPSSRPEAGRLWSTVSGRPQLSIGFRASTLSLVLSFPLTLPRLKDGPLTRRGPSYPTLGFYVSAYFTAFEAETRSNHPRSDHPLRRICRGYRSREVPVPSNRRNLCRRK